MRRLWAAVKLAVLGVVLGGLIGVGAGLSATALYRWGEGQGAAPAGEPSPGLVSVAANSAAEGPARNHRLLVAIGPSTGPLDEQTAITRRRT
ncbi:MAG: hypothetical protein ABR540_11145 [Acidimicrobiales bacterium]